MVTDERRKRDINIIMIVLYMSACLSTFLIWSVERRTERHIDQLETRIHLLEREVQKIEAQTRVGGNEIEIPSEEMSKALLFPMPIHEEDYIDFSSPYGERFSPFTGKLVFHTGIDLYGWDFQSTKQARIIAVFDGTAEVWPVPNGHFKGLRALGGAIRLHSHDGMFMAEYGHLSEIYIRDGQAVRKGDVIARQGSSGRSTGAHLHFELRNKGELVNPLLYIQMKGE